MRTYYPKTEAGMEAVTRALLDYMNNNPDRFPDPPVPPAELKASLDAFVARKHEASRALESYDGALAQKNACLRVLVHGACADPRFGGFIAGYDDDPEGIREQARRSAGASNLPGQVSGLEISGQGKDWVYLDWKMPKVGGIPTHYRVERRDSADGDWTFVLQTTDCDATDGELAPGRVWEYRVIAVNDSGHGPASETAAVRL